MVAVCALVVIYEHKTWIGHRDWTLVLVAALFALLGFHAIRHTAFFIIGAIPLLTRPFRSLQPSAESGWMRGAVHGGLLLALAIGSAAVVQQLWATSIKEPLSQQAIAAVRSCDGTLYNTYDTGGELIWSVPERPVFVDNRQDPFPPDLLFRAVAAEQQGDYTALFTTYNVTCALVPARQPIFVALRRDEWETLYSDAELAVLRRRPSQNQGK
jgi:hypothetical protein